MNPTLDSTKSTENIRSHHTIWNRWRYLVCINLSSRKCHPFISNSDCNVPHDDTGPGALRAWIPGNTSFVQDEANDLICRCGLPHSDLSFRCRNCYWFPYPCQDMSLIELLRSIKQDVAERRLVDTISILIKVFGWRLWHIPILCLLCLPLRLCYPSDKEPSECSASRTSFTISSQDGLSDVILLHVNCQTRRIPVTPELQFANRTASESINSSALSTVPRLRFQLNPVLQRVTTSSST